MASKCSNHAIDTHLLKVFITLMQERSVSRTALRVNQSQPAISLVLRRLRELFDDPILVREKGGMVPTERALALLAHAEQAMDQLTKMFESGLKFSPEQSNQVFRIGAPDYLAPSFMAAVVTKLRRAAPNVRVVLHALGRRFDFESALAHGELDVVIGNWPEPPDRMHLSMLLEDEIVCMLAAEHPLARRGISLEDYQRMPHVVPTPYSISQRGLIDKHLASARIERAECVEVQSFMLAPYLLPGTDMVFTTTRHFADYYCKLLPLVQLPAPMDFPRMRFYQLWHARNHPDAAHQWLRTILSEAGKALVPET